MTKPATVQITTPTDREVVLTREFNAPRSLVFDALTKPELLRRWYGQQGWELVVCEVDLREGGSFRYVSRRPDGKDVGQRGVFVEVVKPERIVHRETWEDWDAGETVATVVLVERNGKTTLTSTALFPSREVRDTVLKSGMERGAAELYDRLADLLASTVARPGA